VFRLRTQRRDFERALLETGVLFVLVIALAAGLVAGLDAIWERRREMVILLSAGIAPKVLRRTQALFLSIPLLLSCFLGAGAGALIDAALDTGAQAPVRVAGDLVVSLSLVVATSFVFASLVARWAISMRGLLDAVRTP
jgi:hypothetical protein